MCAEGRRLESHQNRVVFRTFAVALVVALMAETQRILCSEGSDRYVLSVCVLVNDLTMANSSWQNVVPWLVCMFGSVTFTRLP